MLLTGKLVCAPASSAHKDRQAVNNSGLVLMQCDNFNKQVNTPIRQQPARPHTNPTCDAAHQRNM
jgi:hypothetical protein